MTYKEQREFETLSTEIEQLTAEKATIEAAFSSGEGVDDFAAMSERFQQVKDLLDEKELRWLELSELAN